ncbi:MAG: acyltransferase family protein, partial [Stellaceae bacterium]
MFGTLRLLLAIGVVIGHVGPEGTLIFGVGPGIAAVICFYMISGYAMTALCDGAFRGDALGFYADRFVRLAPQYYFYTIVCAVCIYGAGISLISRPPLDLTTLISAATVIPFQLYSGAIVDAPAWTLAIEAIFYVMLPLLLRSRAGLWLAAGASGAVWLMATHGVIETDRYGYWTFPGVLSFLLVGVALRRRDWRLFGALCAMYAGNAVTLWHGAKLGGYGLNSHVLAGAAIGCVVVPLFARLRRRAWDDRLGNLSYGVYLAHWPIVVGWLAGRGDPWGYALAVAASCAAGAASYA